jgi:transposase
LVSSSYVSKVLIRRRRTGETSARPQCCHVPAKLSHYHAAIREQVAAKPDATLAELRTWLAQTHQVSVSVTLMWETLAQLRLTLKKRPCTRRNRTARMSPRLASPGAKASLR